MRIAIICGLALLSSSSAFAQSLTGADIQKSLVDKRVSLSCVDGTRGSGSYKMAKNFGIITGRYQRPGGQSEQDVGEVRAEGDQLCLTFKLLNDGREQCFGVRSTGNGRFAVTAVAGLVEACQVAQI
jgi:hypothetical protein